MVVIPEPWSKPLSVNLGMLCRNNKHSNVVVYTTEAMQEMAVRCWNVQWLNFITVNKFGLPQRRQTK